MGPSTLQEGALEPLTMAEEVAQKNARIYDLNSGHRFGILSLGKNGNRPDGVDAES